MKLYMDVNYKINQIYRTFVSDEDIHVYSVDETFLDVTDRYDFSTVNGVGFSAKNSN